YRPPDGSACDNGGKVKITRLRVILTSVPEPSPPSAPNLWTGSSALPFVVARLAEQLVGGVEDLEFARAGAAHRALEHHPLPQIEPTDAVVAEPDPADLPGAVGDGDLEADRVGSGYELDALDDPGHPAPVPRPEVADGLAARYVPEDRLCPFGGDHTGSLAALGAPHQSHVVRSVSSGVSSRCRAGAGQ